MTDIAKNTHKLIKKNTEDPHPEIKVSKVKEFQAFNINQASQISVRNDDKENKNNGPFTLGFPKFQEQSLLELKPSSNKRSIKKSEYLKASIQSRSECETLCGTLAKPEDSAPIPINNQVLNEVQGYGKKNAVILRNDNINSAKQSRAGKQKSKKSGELANKSRRTMDYDSVKKVKLNFIRAFLILIL